MLLIDLHLWITHSCIILIYHVKIPLNKFVDFNLLYKL